VSEAAVSHHFKIFIFIALSRAREGKSCEPSKTENFVSLVRFGAPHYFSLHSLSLLSLSLCFSASKGWSEFKKKYSHVFVHASEG
jgi:hypothetical protein